MSFKIYGKKGRPVITSESYDRGLVLQSLIKRQGRQIRELLAEGKWNGVIFCLMKDACIRKQFEAKSNTGGNDIINELLLDKAFIDLNADDEYYILNRDIGLHSPSAAANLVHGNDRNGQDCWENNGQTLTELNLV
jgi:hypothetical protein